MYEKTITKQEKFHVDIPDVTSISEVNFENLDVIRREIDKVSQKFMENVELGVICELAKRYIEDEQHSRGRVIHCLDCQIKRPLTIGRITVWRCPHRTHDVKPDGFCESGVKM